MNNTISKGRFIFVKRSVPITNNPVILQWLVNNQQYSYRDKLKNLSRNMVDDLLRLFGKPNRKNLWYLEYNNIYFNVYSVVGTGTRIEICGYSYSDINQGMMQTQIIEFLITLHNLINS